MLDMVVATTRSPVEHAAGLQVARGHEQDGVAVDHVALRAGEHAAVGVAVEGEAEIAPRFWASEATNSGWSAPHSALMLRPSGAMLSSVICARHSGSRRRKSSGAMAAAAPLAQSATMLRPASERPGTQSDKELNVVGQVRGIVVDGREAGGVGDLHLSGVVEDFFFHRKLDRVGQLESVSAEELDAVVVPWIVGSGDDDAGVEAVSARKERDGGCGDYAGALDDGTCLAQASGKCGGDPRAGLAGVAAEENPRARCSFSQRVREREADAVDGRGVERCLAGNCANAVGAEELACAVGSHDADFLPRLRDLGAASSRGETDSTRLENVPSVRCVVS